MKVVHGNNKMDWVEPSSVTRSSIQKDAWTTATFLFQSLPSKNLVHHYKLFPMTVMENKTKKYNFCSSYES